MHELESNLHELLESISGEVYASEDQAMIIASAAARCEVAGMGRRICEAQMIQHLLDAVDGYEVSEESAWGPLDARGLTASQILKAAGRRGDDDEFGVDLMNFDGDDLDVFLGRTPDRDPNAFFVDDNQMDWSGAEPHRPSLYRKPGSGSHRTDSHVRG